MSAQAMKLDCFFTGWVSSTPWCPLRLIASVAVFALIVSGCKSSEKGPVVIICGGSAEHSCPIGMFCDLKGECGGFDGEGVCRIVPTDCPSVDNPKDDAVCGCDGNTYISPCFAHASAMSVAYEGPCLRAN